MTILVIEREPVAIAVEISDEFLTVMLKDGRRISNPLAWYPRLLHGKAAERERYEILGEGEVLRWPYLDEDLSVESIVAGRRSAESQQSLERWLAQR
jgi:hypothetical protein